ncbi:hypothetical protein ACJMK2_007519 [Sinanodonta woodiana]|uniref:Uncharacterized protein n=1 Tax=Sinanodonta woodiana TaxID=1069815 RepID=A0ABD3VIS1_SINWO
MLSYIPKHGHFRINAATTEAETVWLTEVTTGLQTDKRGVTIPDFPDQLLFHVKGKTHELVLNLEKNNRIDQNVDTYIVQSTIDGQSLMEKMKNLDKADVAYYQDVDNGAFMTARCVKRSSGQCDILINGNIRLGDRSYNMRPSDAYAIPSDFLELMGLRGKRYVLQDQALVLSGMSEQNNEETSGVENNVEDKYTDLPRRMPYPYEQDKQNLFIKRDDKARDLNNYYVDVVVVADSGLWDFFLMLADSIGPHDREDRAYAEIKQYVVQFVHGVDGIFRGIEDHSIAISVGLVGFVLLKDVGLFPHEAATVEIQGGISMIDGDKYLQDLQKWDTQVGSTKFESYDQVILLTR